MANEFEWKTKVSNLLDAIKIKLAEHTSSIADVDGKIAEAVRRRDESFKKKIGFVEVTACENIPEDYLLCNGAELNREEYSELFAAIGTKYGEGDGETTFNVPNLDGKFVEGAGAVELGTSIAAGLPDHTHTYTDYYAAFQQGHGGDYPLVSSGNTASTRATSGADNAIYGGSATVQPPAVALCYVIKYQ